MLSTKEIKYLGIKQPKTIQEIKVEVLGLRNAIKQAEEKITRLNQAISIAELQEFEAINEQSEKQSESKETNPEDKKNS